MVEKAEEHTIISIHNHPNSTVPSLDDINTAWKKKYKYGIVVCHNGNIYKYTILGDFNEIIVDSLLEKINNLVYNKNKLNDFNTQLNKYINLLYKENVNLEVILC